MRKIFLMLCLACGCATVGYAQGVKKKVAVYVTGEVESSYKKIIGSKLVSGITRSDSYAAVERTADFLSVLNREKDYQTSGEVSDNQIVKLGQQFGVRYVFVADVSELFEMIFISARMIDVQTGQITASTEASQEIGSIEQLITLTSQVIAGIMDKTDTPNWDIKTVGPFGTNKELYSFKMPEGYRHMSESEIKRLAKMGMIDFPAYIGVSSTPKDSYNAYTVYYTLIKSEDDIITRSSYFHIFSDGTISNVSPIPTGFVYVKKKE